MIERRRDGSKVIVTFRIPGEAAESACVVGDFNDWSQGTHRMSRADGSFTITIPLDPGPGLPVPVPTRRRTVGERLGRR